MMLSHEGIELKGLAFDTMLASYVLDATRSSHGIEEIALEYLGYKALTQEDICGTGQKALRAALICRLPRFLSFAGERSDLAWQLEREARRPAARGQSGVALPRSRASARSPCSPTSSGTACASICPRSQASRSASTPTWPRAARKFSSWPARSSTSTRRSSCRRFFSRSSSSRPPNGPARHAWRRPRSTCSRSWRSHTSFRSSSSNGGR